MSIPSSSYDQILPLQAYLELNAGFSEIEPSSLGLNRISENVIEITVLESVSFQIDRLAQKVFFNEADKEQVSAVSVLLGGQSAFAKSIYRFISNEDEKIKFYLSTRNKILIEEEFEKENLVESHFKKSVYGFDFINKPEAELGILDCFFIEFSSGEFFRFSDLCNHPMGILLPWEMMKEDGGNRSILWRKQVLRPDAAVYEKEDNIASVALSSIPKLIKEGRLDLYLVEKPYEDRGYSLAFTGSFKVSHRIKEVEISDVLFEEAFLKLEGRNLVLDLKYTIDVSKARMMDSVFHIKETAKLYITKEDEIREKIKDLFAADKLRFQLKSLAFNISEDSLKSKVSYSESFFQNPIDKVKKLEELLPIPISHDLNVKSATPERLSLAFSNVEPSKVELKYPHLSLDPNSNIIGKILKILMGLKGGVSAFLGKDAANIAVKGNKRLSELKLLKSSGFFAFLLYEIIEASKNGAEIDDSVLWERLDKVILKLIQPDSKDVSDAVSHFFIDYVDLCVKELFDRDQYEVLQVMEDQIAIMSYQTSVFNFVSPLLSNLTSYYKSQTFSLDNFQGFELNPKQSIKEGLSVELHSPCPLNIGNFITENDCIVNQERVRIMKKDAFKAELKVVDDSDGANKKIDWFELDPKYYFDGVEISEEEAKAFRSNSLVRHNGQMYFIPETEAPVVKWLNYFWDRISLDKKNSGPEDPDADGESQFYRSHILDILALRQAGVPVEGGERWQEIAGEYDSLEKNADFSVEGFEGKLKAFQEKGVSWLSQLYRIGLGGILADDMGLGKTVQVLAFLNHLQTLDKKRLHLIVLPTSLIHNWRSEAEKFTPDAKVIHFKSGMQDELKMFDKGIVLITYGLLTEHQEFLREFDWDVVIFDEAQQLKNIKSMRSQAARTLKGNVKICLTGTPMENHYGEFFSLVDLSVPGALGEHGSFMKVYGPRKVSAGAVGKKEIDYLKLKSKPLVLRRTKSEVLTELPDKTESIVKIDFDDKQREIYRNVAMSWNSKVQKLLVDQGESKSQIQMFAALMKLRQVCSCPDVVVGSEYKVLSPKLSQVVEQAQELLSAGKSVLIFTNFISTLDGIKNELKKRDLNVLSITGKDSQKKREQTLNEFNDEGEKALVMTLKTGGVGLNLTKANYIIHVEPWWNPAAENQGTDRAHRIGQKQSVHVYRYIMNNSIEEKIQTLKESKQEAFDLLMVESTEDLDSTSFKGGSGLTKKDFEYLLS